MLLLVRATDTYILYSYSQADGYVNVEIYILCDDDAASIVIYARNEQSKGGNKNQE